MEVYSFTTGIASTEQDLITAIDSFLVSTIGGWTRFDTVSDTSSNRDYVWKTPGSDPSTYSREHWVRMRGQSDQIHVYGYGTYESVSVYTFQLYNGTYTYFPTGSTLFRYWLIGNKDFIQVHIKNGSSGSYYMTYAGFIRSYYVPENDDYPLLIRGQTVASSYWWTSNTSFMHNATTSGQADYVAYLWNTQVGYDKYNRTQEVCLLPTIIWTGVAGTEEVRGEAYGVYQISGALVGHATPLTTASGTFICFKMNDNNDHTYAYGPITSDSIDASLW